MNIKELKELIVLMNENQLVEIELEREGMKVRLRKGGEGPGGIIVERTMTGGLPAALNAPVPAAASEAEPSSNFIEIKSPMVGTFYRAPAPEAPPFVQVGQEIQPGQVLCILEAMKLMNEIKSDVKGKITRILVENAQPVEFGQPLFLVEPA